MIRFSYSYFLFYFLYSTETVDNCTAEAAASGLCIISEIDEALCPPDSHLVDPSEGCVCRIHLCARPQCRSGFEPVLRKKGKAVPGDCCDVYECPKGNQPALHTLLYYLS